MSFHKIKKTHQIFIDDTMSLPREIPHSIECSRKSSSSIYPEAEYHLWSGEELRYFIKYNFDSDVLSSFDKLKAYAFKCDLARYCIMYCYGGIYFDLSIIMENYWEIPINCRVAAFSEQYKNMPLWTNTQQSLLWSLPQQREWELAIKYIVNNCKKNFYGPHDHYVTGPALLGRCMAQTLHEEGVRSDINSQYMGEVRYTTESDENKTCVFVSPSCDLIAFRNKKTAGSAKEIGIDKGNSYPDLWKLRNIYGERKSKWLASESVIRVTNRAVQNNDGIHIKRGKKERATFGPYIFLSPGNYKLIILCTGSSRFLFSEIEVSSKDNKVYSKKVINYNLTLEGREIIAEFFIKNRLTDVEFRFYPSSISYGTIKSIKLIGPYR